MKLRSLICRTELKLCNLGERYSPNSFGERKWDLVDLQKGYEILQSWRMMIVLTALEKGDENLQSYKTDMIIYYLGL